MPASGTTVDRTEPAIFRKSTPPLRIWVSEVGVGAQLRRRKEADIQPAAACLLDARGRLFEPRVDGLGQRLSGGELVGEFGRVSRPGADRAEREDRGARQHGAAGQLRFRTDWLLLVQHRVSFLVFNGIGATQCSVVL